MIGKIKQLFRRNITVRAWMVVIGLAVIPYTVHAVAISALTALTGAASAGGDTFVVVDISEAVAADRTKKITRDELAVAMAAGFANDAITGDDIEGGTIGTVTVGTLTLTNDLAVTQGGTGASSLTNLITTTEILADTILEVDIDAVDVASDEECLTFESGAGGDFEWQDCGNGDSIQVEDGDNAGTFTVIDTTASFEDQGDINYVVSDGGAGGPDHIQAFVRADSVALTTDTTGNYVATVAAGTGITIAEGDSEGATKTVVSTLGIAIDSAEIINGAILEADFKVVDTPTDEECLTFESTVGDFEWQDCGNGDSIQVEDGDNAGTFTVIDTTASFEDQGDINYVVSDGGAGGPDHIQAFVRADSVALTTDTTGNYAAGDAEAGAATSVAANSVALTTDTTGNYVATVAAGTGISIAEADSEGATKTVVATLGTAIDSTEITDNTILEVDLKAVDTAVDEECLTFESTTGDFEWQSCGGTGSITDNGNAEAMVISSDEEITMPLQPCFFAFNSVSDNDVTGTNSAITVDFDTEKFDRGANFTTDTFTAPVTGLYQLNATALIGGLTSAADTIFIRIVSSNQNIRSGQHTDAGDLGDVVGLVVTAVVEMDASDTAFIEVLGSGEASAVHDILGDATAAFTHFSGCLVA